MEANHGARHGLAGRVGIEATVNLAALVQERAKPAGIGPDAGGGDAPVLGMEDKAADGVDGRLAEDDGTLQCGAPEQRKRDRGKRKEAQVFFGTGGHTAPGVMICSAEFCADRSVFLSQQNENSIGSVISVEGARLDERVDEGGRKTALMEQIMSDAAELSGIWRRQFQTRSGKGLID